jgi:L-serine dehydratase
MDNSFPSIFNDVIGPVMRGPSSSHCAAAVRIGRIVRDLMDGDIADLLVEFDPHGSLATTHTSQGSDMGLFAGLLGWDTDDERLLNSADAVRAAGIAVRFNVTPIEANHPNTYRMTVSNSRERHTLAAISTGGGIIEIVELDGARVSMAGDYYETLLFVGSDADRLLAHLKGNIQADEILLLRSGDICFIEIKSQGFLPRDTLSALRAKFDIRSLKQIAPVLPVLSRKEMKVPFITCAGMLDYNRGKDLDLAGLALRYECARGGLTSDLVLEKMTGILGIMQGAVRLGLAGTHYDDRILGFQSGNFLTQMDARRLIDGGVLNRIILDTTAIMESKSAMGLIVAAPTAGSCGGLPGAVIGAAEAMGLSITDQAHAMLAGGLIGVFIAAHATFAAEVGGCQAECGSGSGMAAAALVTLAGGTTLQAINAVSMALQNVLGMVCDPVANRVEVPCLGKNVLAASNALACANMALAGYDPVIPLDEVIRSMDEVGKLLPSALRCTGYGGLSITPSAKAIEKRLAQNSG